MAALPGPLLREEPPRDGRDQQAQGDRPGSARHLRGESVERALGLVSSVAEKWRGKGNEKVAEHLEEHVEE